MIEEPQATATLQAFNERLVNRPPFGRAVIGFTGSREGPTPEQAATWEYVRDRLTGISFHNGCAVGADQHTLIERGSYWALTLWPASKERDAWAKENMKNYRIHGVLPPLERNRRMATEVYGMIAMPITAEEQLRSGTWATVRYTRQLGKPILFIRPDGQLRLE